MLQYLLQTAKRVPRLRFKKNCKWVKVWVFHSSLQSLLGLASGGSSMCKNKLSDASEIRLFYLKKDLGHIAGTWGELALPSWVHFAASRINSIQTTLVLSGPLFAIFSSSSLFVSRCCRCIAPKRSHLRTGEFPRFDLALTHRSQTDSSRLRWRTEGFSVGAVDWQRDPRT